jgi:RNA methyltransferase, TrmH family
MITSPHNEKLKLIRKLHSRRERERSGLFVAEGEDLTEAAAAAGVAPELVLIADSDITGELLDSVSTLGSGTRVIGVYRQRWSDPGGELSAYLHGVGDPGNIGAVIRAAHALCDGPVVLGSGCADPYSPKAVRASMGSVFARPPARARLGQFEGFKLALDPRGERPIGELEIDPPVVICLGAERQGLPAEILSSTDASARIPIRPDGPESLNVAIAGSIALHQLANRMAAGE